MTTLEEQLAHAMADASSHLVLSPGIAVKAWKRGRRRHHQRQAAGASLAVAVLGVAGIGLRPAGDRSTGGTAFAGSSPSALQGTPVPAFSAIPSAPNPTPDSSASVSVPASPDPRFDPAVAAVKLPDPAPGFPLRRMKDQGDGIFLLGVTPSLVRGQEGTPTDHEATVIVTRAPGDVFAYPVIGHVTVRGVSGTVVQVGAHQIGVQAVVNGFNLEAYGDNSVAGSDVSPAQLVALLDALTGI